MVAEEEQEEKDVLVMGVVVDVLLMLLLRLWNILYNDFSENILIKNKWLPTEGPTDGRTDTPSCRDSRTHLKRKETQVRMKGGKKEKREDKNGIRRRGRNQKSRDKDQN